MTINYTVPADDSERALSVILRSKLCLSGACVKSLKRTGAYNVNGICLHMNYKVQAGDVISVDISDKESPSDIVPINMDIKILYEDDCFLAVNKPANMPVHPSVHHYEDTLANGVMYILRERGAAAVIHPIIRLDMDTSGIVLFALNAHAHALMNGLQHPIIKKYIAVFEGSLENDCGVLDFPIAREADSIIRRTVRPDGKTAVTEYRVLKRFNGMTLAEVILHTGRTHQIRVHFAHIGHPIVGDTLYGNSSPFIERQALHASEISFIDPFSKREIKICSDIPDDIRMLIAKNDVLQ